MTSFQQHEPLQGQMDLFPSTDQGTPRYTKPVGTVEPDESVGPGPVEQMQQDVAAKKVTRPEGAPAMVPFHALPRRRRSDFVSAIAPIITLDESELQNGKTTVESIRAAIYATADMQDALELVSDDREAFVPWAESQPDSVVQQLFFWYFDRFDVGKAFDSLAL